MNSTEIKQRYRITIIYYYLFYFRNVLLVCFTAELNEYADSQSMYI